MKSESQLLFFNERFFCFDDNLLYTVDDTTFLIIFNLLFLVDEDGMILVDDEEEGMILVDDEEEGMICFFFRKNILSTDWVIEFLRSCNIIYK